MFLFVCVRLNFCYTNRWLEINSTAYSIQKYLEQKVQMWYTTWILLWPYRLCLGLLFSNTTVASWEFLSRSWCTLQIQFLSPLIYYNVRRAEFLLIPEINLCVRNPRRLLFVKILSIKHVLDTAESSIILHTVECRVGYQSCSFCHMKHVKFAHI